MQFLLLHSRNLRTFYSPVEGVASYVFAALGGSGKPTIPHIQIVIHPDYDAATYANDLALLKLGTPAKVDGS
jgi:hypothetical protein